MPLYMMQAAYAAEPPDALPEGPKSRGEIMATQLEKVGGRLLGFYRGSGKYDAVAICELPDDVTAGTFAHSVRNPVHLNEIKTVRLRGALPERLVRLRR